jgi:hypothetical protein
MYVYHVRSLVEIEIDKLEVDVIHEEPGTTKEEREEAKEQFKEDLRQENIDNGGDGSTTISEYEFNLVAEDFLTAVTEAIDFLEETNPNWYNILDISEVKDKKDNSIEIANLKDKPCNCAYCQAQTCSPDMLIVTTCPKCKGELRLADAFDNIKCIHCGEVIQRSEIKVNAKGQYEVIREKKNSKKKSE